MELGSIENIGKVRSKGMGKQAEHEWGMGGAGGGAATATGGNHRAPLRQLHDVWICNEKAAVTAARASHRPWRVVARLALARPGENSQLCLDSEGLFTFAHGLEHFGHRPGHHAGRRRRAAGSPRPGGFRAGVDGLIAEDCVSFPGARLAVDEEAAVDTVEQVADGQVGAAGVYLWGGGGEFGGAEGEGVEARGAGHGPSVVGACGLAVAAPEGDGKRAGRQGKAEGGAAVR